MAAPRNRRRTTKDQREIAKRREALGLGQKELAAMAGCSVSTISKIERGEVVARGATLESILSVLRSEPLTNEPKGIRGWRMEDVLTFLNDPAWEQMHPLLRNRSKHEYEPMPAHAECISYQFSYEHKALGTNPYRATLYLYPDGRPGALDIASLGYEHGEHEGSRLITLLLQYGIGLGLIERCLRGHTINAQWFVLVKLYHQLKGDNSELDFGGSQVAHAVSWACRCIEERYPPEGKQEKPPPRARPATQWGDLTRWTGYDPVVHYNDIVKELTGSDQRLEMMMLLISAAPEKHADSGDKDSRAWVMTRVREAFNALADDYDAEAIISKPELMKKIALGSLDRWLLEEESRFEPESEQDPVAAQARGEVYKNTIDAVLKVLLGNSFDFDWMCREIAPAKRSNE